jgi:hypothetical protein
MEAHGLTPILNVSSLAASFDWFEPLGWEKRWDWTPPDGTESTFGAVGSGCVRHPDGHVFRISRGIGHDHEHPHDPAP